MNYETTTGPTFRDLQFERKYRSRELKEEIKDLEREFQFTNKLNDPGQWFYLQDQLGIVYKKLMTMNICEI